MQSNLSLQLPNQNNQTNSYQNRSTTFLQRFKSKQSQLKNKFKIFLKSQTNKFVMNQKNILLSLQKQEDLDDLIDIRKIRSEKKYLSEEFKKNANAINFIDHKNEQKQKTFYSLKRKVQKVQHLRSSRKNQLKTLEKTLRNIKQQIMNQKKRYKKSIMQSKRNSQYSRLLCQRQKLQIANYVRNDKIMNQEIINQQRYNDVNNNKMRCSHVRQIQKRNANISISRVYLQKRNNADQLKLNRLVRELAQREFLKIKVQNLKKIRENKQLPYMQNSNSLGKEIDNLRKSLCQKQFIAYQKKNSDKKKINLRYKSFTEGKQDYQTDTLLPSHFDSRIKNHSLQLFND